MLGMESGKRHLLQIMLNLNLLMMLVRHPFSTFSLEKIASGIPDAIP